MANLLERASVVLTPTAYNNGEALCIKPDDASGDFDFSRNSAATRVNAQGLVENVQILSSNLVQNGDFSEEGAEEVSNGSFSQEGVELVTNGSFDTDSDWALGSGTTISDGKLNIDFVGAGNTAFQGISFTSGSTSKVVVVCSSYTSGRLDVRVGSNAVSSIIDGVGTYTFYIKEGGYPYINFFTGIGFTGSIESVSVREVGQDWVLTSGAAIGENKLDINANAYDYFARQLDVSTIGKTYKVSVDAEIQSGRMILYLADTNAFEVIDTSGSYTFYIVADGTQIRFRAFDTALIGSITNISVKEVGQNWNLQTGWQISENKLNCLGSSSQIEASTLLNFDITKKYKLVFTISGVDSGTRSFRVYTQGSNGGVIFSYTSHINGTYEYYYDPSINGTKLAFQTAFNQSTFSIDDVSVIEITDDTNLPRINYEGFSYQDVLGSEEVVNGGFDTNLNNWVAYSNTLISWESGGYALLDSNNNYWCKIKQSNVFEIGKTYKVILTAKSNRTDLSFHNSPITGSFSQADTFETFEQYYTATTTDFLFGYANAGSSTITIDNVSVKEYLGQSVVPNSGCGSWLFEPQSTNLVTYSEDFRSNSNFTTSAPNSIFESGYLAPDGSLTATRINGFDGYYVTLSSLGSGDARSMYVKSGNGQTGNVNLLDPNSHTHSLFEVTNEWKRVELVGADSWFYIVDGRGASLTLDDVIVWGLQQEELSFATSYIPTSGSQVTRNQDLCTNGGSLATINSTEGVFYAEIKRDTPANTFHLISLNNASSNSDRNSVTIGVNSSDNFYVRVKSPSGTFTSQTIPMSIVYFHKIAIR